MAFLSGCVFIPYEPDSDVDIAPPADSQPHETRLSCDGDGDGLVERLSTIVQSTDERIEVVDTAELKELLFPDGDQRLSTFLEEENRGRIAGMLDIDYLVITGDFKKVTLDEKGHMGFFMGFFGAGYEKREATLEATIFDMRTGKALNRLKAEAHGTSGSVGLFYGLIIAADEKGSVEQGIGQKVAEILLGQSKDNSVRVVIFAVE